MDSWLSTRTYPTKINPPLSVTYHCTSCPAKNSLGNLGLFLVKLEPFYGYIIIRIYEAYIQGQGLGIREQCSFPHFGSTLELAYMQHQYCIVLNSIRQFECMSRLQYIFYWKCRNTKTLGFGVYLLVLSLLDLEVQEQYRWRKTHLDLHVRRYIARFESKTNKIWPARHVSCMSLIN